MTHTALSLTQKKVSVIDFFFLSSLLSECDTKGDPRSYVLEMTESAKLNP